MERPDLSQLTPEIVAYIEFLEEQLVQTQEKETTSGSALPPSEPPTTLNVITLTLAGIAKRTPRHLYSRQRRGGMGVFDLEAPEDDPPAFLTIADESDTLLVFTNQGRAFRVPVADLPESEVRARGSNILKTLSFREGEKMVAVLPDAGIGEYISLVSERGWVKRVRHTYLSDRMIPGTTFHNVKEGGYLAAACWSYGREQLCIVTRNGKGIRFDEVQVPTRGCLGIRVDPDDQVVGIAPTNDEGGVFIMRAEGKGTIRLMEGFRQNKAPGAGGKVIMKADDVIGVTAIESTDDILAISRLGKMIRFGAEDVPAKTGVVQGVHCFNLRADEVVAIARALPASPQSDT